jgi:hypothetical protein
LKSRAIIAPKRLSSKRENFPLVHRHISFAVCTTRSKLAPLLVLHQLVAVMRAGEAALRRQGCAGWISILQGA